MTKSKATAKRKGAKLASEECDTGINRKAENINSAGTTIVIVIDSDNDSDTNATQQQQGHTSLSRKIDSSTVIPRGRPKSGRVWKTTRTQSHNDMMRMNTLKTSWSQKMKLRLEAKALKIRERELKETRAKELQIKHARRELNKKRRQENERKAEVVQPIKNTAKIRRMKKKQLRMIAKR